MTNVAAKVLIRALMFTMQDLKLTAEQVKENLPRALMEAAGGCPVKFLQALEVLKEIEDELEAERNGSAISVFSKEKSTARHENFD